MYKKVTQQILLGSEVICPEDKVIPRLRFLLEKIDLKEVSTFDLIELIKSFKDYPVTAIIEELLVSANATDQLLSILRLVDHLEYNPLASQMRVILKSYSIEPGQEDVVRKQTLAFLNEMKESSFSEIYTIIERGLQEKDNFTQMKNIIEFYETLYEDEFFSYLDRALEHYVTLKSDIHIWNLLGLVTENIFFERIGYLRREHKDARIEEAMSKGQVKSKLWARDELLKLVSLKEKNILILCGWYSIISQLFFEKETDIKKIRSVDIDSECELVADAINQKQLIDSWKFKASTKNIHEIDYSNIELKLINKKGESFNETLKYDLIINTSCEHLEDFSKWYDKIPKGTLLLLQTNDFFDCEEHVNCVQNLEEFKEMVPMSECLYQGELVLEKYTRFMIIGKK